MRKILFPTDFSKTADNAFVYALEMANYLEAELILLHVYSLPIVSYEGYPSYILEVYDLIDLNNFENFKDQVPHLREIAEKHRLEHIKMTHILEEGDFVSVVKKIVKKEKIDMIVMGTTGASGLKETFVGSNTVDVLNHIQVATLCVPDKSKFRKVQRIGFTTLYREKDYKALLSLMVLSKKMKAEVKCLYVKTFDTKVDATTKEKWRADFKDEAVDFFEIPSENIKGAIFGFMSDKDINVLAMLNYKRSFFEKLFQKSIVDNMAFHSKTPILILPEE